MVQVFLVGIIETAKNGVMTFDSILKLKKENEEKIQHQSVRSNHILKLMEHLYQRSIVNAQQVTHITGVSDATAYKIIGEMEKMNIIREITGGKRGKTYVYDDYIKLF
jgi:Fic family protein